MVNAAVLFSGGLDSTAALLWAKREGYNPIPIFFNYGQKNYASERLAVDAICHILKITPVILSMPVLSEIGGSSLTTGDQVNPHKSGEVNDTFVPGRNLLFVTAASAWASVNKVRNVVTGIRESQDFPDCRVNTLNSLSNTITQGIGNMYIHHPIMKMSRVQTFDYLRSSDYPLIDTITVSCYNGNNCGVCKPCVDRTDALKLITARG